MFRLSIKFVLINNKQTHFILEILNSNGKSEFILLIFIPHEVLCRIYILSNQLRNIDAALGKSVNTINGVTSTFKSLQTDKSFANRWTRIEQFSEEREIDHEIPSFGYTFYLIYFTKTIRNVFSFIFII